MSEEGSLCLCETTCLPTPRMASSCLRSGHACSQEAPWENLLPANCFDNLLALWNFCILILWLIGECLYFLSLLCNVLIISNTYLAPHRDLKPENILVTIEGDIKIADFGVSKDFSSDMDGGDSDSSRRLGMVKDTKGSWSYWAPEMIDDKQSNSYSAYAADVWAGGVCLWQFVFGCLPFWAPQPGNSPSLMFEAILSIKDGLPALPSRKSPELVQLIAAMLEADPTKRPAFRDLSSFAWIQEHTSESIEQQLKKASSLTIDRSADSLDVSNAVTPGHVNVLTENTKAHILNMAQRVKARVKERRSSIKAAKDVEIQTKKEVRRSFDSQASADLSAQLVLEKVRASPPATPDRDRDVNSESDVDLLDISVGGVGAGREGSRTPPIMEVDENVEDADAAAASLVQRIDEGVPGKDGQMADLAASVVPKSTYKKSKCCAIQ
jgi:serine/threonine protein kinase